VACAGRDGALPEAYGAVAGALALEEMIGRVTGSRRRAAALGVQVAMVTGDARSVAEASLPTRIDEVFAEVLPEHKAERSSRSSIGYRVAMVGEV